MLRCASLCLLLGVAPPAVAGEGSASPARYSFVAVEEGALRLDTETGAVLLCTVEDGAPVCTSVLDDTRQSAYRAPPTGDIAALRARVAALESQSAEARLVLPDDEVMDRVMSLAERMMRRFIGMVRGMKDETGGEDL